jgi:hypothetical protein
MGIRLTKPFRAFTVDEISQVSATLGVFELADGRDRVLYIGYAGGRSLFGLRGTLMDFIEKTSASRFRVEINSAYLTRYQELLMAHIADFDVIPVENDEKERLNLGRLSPG